MTLFQSTRPRGARLDAGTLSPRTRDVSIHAPARGATRPAENDAPVESVSIHAPARGATTTLRPLVRRRLVSIHAPARGATVGADVIDFAARRVSIHAPARGATSLKPA